jgi:hypothetical protein
VPDGVTSGVNEEDLVAMLLLDCDGVAGRVALPESVPCEVLACVKSADFVILAVRAWDPLLLALTVAVIEYGLLVVVEDTDGVRVMEIVVDVDGDTFELYEELFDFVALQSEFHGMYSCHDTELLYLRSGGSSCNSLTWRNSWRSRLHRRNAGGPCLTPSFAR